MNNEELQKEIEMIKARLDALSNYVTIPLEVGNALKARIIPEDFMSGRVVSGVPPTQTVINTNGANPPVNYTVPTAFTGKIGITINNTEYVLPYI